MLLVLVFIGLAFWIAFGLLVLNVRIHDALWEASRPLVDFRIVTTNRWFKYKIVALSKDQHTQPVTRWMPTLLLPSKRREILRNLHYELTEGINLMPQEFSTTVLRELGNTFGCLNDTVTCPLCVQTQMRLSLWRMVVHLNDHHGWDRESIADWLESTDIEIEAKQ